VALADLLGAFHDASLRRVEGVLGLVRLLSNLDFTNPRCASLYWRAALRLPSPSLRPKFCGFLVAAMPTSTL
jgi:hypothetical protein